MLIIKSRPFKIWVIIISATLAILTTLYIKKSAPSKAPNVILISIDTLRADHLGCYGYSRNTSPNIDAFAKEAVLFKNAISQAPVTATSHMSIFTSLTPAVHKVANYKEDGTFLRLAEQITTLPEVMQKNGYLTIGLHGGLQVSGKLGFDQGFDEYSEEWNNLKDITSALARIRKAIKKSKENNKPLFLFVHHYFCHDPYLSSPEKFSLHFLTDKVEGLPVHPQDILQNDDSHDRRYYFWKNVKLDNPQHINHIISLYDGGVYYSDYIFEKIVEALKENNYYNNSVIILLSDHGEEFYEHQGYLHGRCFIETLHVPLICRFPGGRYAKQVVNNTVRTFDIMPTLFDFLGLKTDNLMQGESLMPLLTKKGTYHPLIVTYADGMSFDDPKAVRFIKDGYVYSNQGSGLTQEWLFDTRVDYQESINLVTIKPEILDQMRVIAKMILEKDQLIINKIGFNRDIRVEKDEHSLRRLKSLGYIQ